MISLDLRLLPETPDASYAHYRARTGPDAVARARGMTPERALEEVQRAGLRGRGGAGFPTGTKWRSVFQHACQTRYVVCNAAEGEPGTFKDRWLLRRNPYATLEGALIAAHVVGAKALYLCLKTSFLPEIARLKAAVEELRVQGVLGALEVHLVEGPEEYLFGEEKALLEVVEGNNPLPREATNPPYEEGLFATVDSPNPAVVNNAETFAHVATILRLGAEVFRGLGTQDTPGTLLFTVSGDVQRPGIYEASAGLSLRELFHDFAGGPRPGRTFKAALSGVSSGILPADRFETKADFASLQLAGSGLGSAGFMVFDDQARLPLVARAVARFLYVESCNQCSACKAGLRTASQAMDRALSAEGTARDLAWVRAGARSAPQGNRCALPTEAAALLPSLLDRFKAEFQGALGTNPTPPWPIPKLVDYDEAHHAFKIDERQQRKRPDWTYDAEPPAQGRQPQPAAVPHDAAHPSPHLTLPHDLLDTLAEHAHEAGASIEELAERALRLWLPGAGKKKDDQKP